MNRSVVTMMLSCVLVTGCTTTKQVSDVSFKPPEGNYRILVMRPDVTVGLKTAGGLVEPRQDWTEQARVNIVSALKAQQSIKGGEATVIESRDALGIDPQIVLNLERMHRSVGPSVQLHKYLGAKLPTKKGVFDWTLGEDATRLGQATNYDYALFIHVEDSFASTGRVALQAVAAVGCMFLVCIMPEGGRQAAYASLVDLKTGRLVWFNALSSSTGDVRKLPEAEDIVSDLLGNMKPGKQSAVKTL